MEPTNDNPLPADPPWTRRPAVIASAAAVVVILAVVAVLVATSGDGKDKDASKGGRTATERSTTTAAKSSTTESSATSTTAAEPTTTTTSTTTAAPTTAAPTTAAPTTTAPPPPPPPPGFSNEDPADPKPAPVGAQGSIAKSPCASTGPPAIASSLTDGPSVDGKQWRTVGSASGNCGGRSDAFRTSGVDTRIVVRSDADQIVVYLENANDPDSNAGYADVVCRSKCSDQQVLVNPAGTYRLRVQATDGPWVVEVQEYR